MISVLGTNIISSLGISTQENFDAVKQGISGVKHYDADTFDLPEAFAASLIDKTRLNEAFHREFGETINHYTNLEKAALLSVYFANNEAEIDLSSDKTIFVLSTTKGNIDWLDSVDENRLFLWHTAELIADFFQNKNKLIVVSNACISGASAQIDAMRALQSGEYDTAVVVGVDFLSKFILSGFQSFKALSSDLCKPFDKERIGLNLGEAAATIIFSRQYSTKSYKTALIDGAICNDATHISAPSRIGEGCYRALESILKHVDKECVSFINAHGTATPYNDAMETVAITRAGLEQIPVNSLKAYFGHTLGAAGVLESIISLKALEENSIVKSLGYESQDFDNRIPIQEELITSNRSDFVKMLSGFGGVNAALLFSKNPSEADASEQTDQQKYYISKSIHLNFENTAEVSAYYRSLQVDYPKFFKMDGLSKLGFVASEALLADMENCFTPREDIAIICFNRSSSLEVDTQYQATIRDNENYFPSPSLFVYTLPNIVAGEMAIRNKFFGETSFYITADFDAQQIKNRVENAFFDNKTNSVLVAWIENFEEKHEVTMFLVGKQQTAIDFTEENIMKTQCK